MQADPNEGIRGKQLVDSREPIEARIALAYALSETRIGRSSIRLL